MRKLHSFPALTALVGISLALLSSGSVLAIGQARISGTITDENRQPLSDVVVSVVCPSVASIRIDSRSDPAGKWAVTLVDSTKIHRYRFEKEGFQPLEFDLKLPIGSNERRDITLKSAAAVAAASLAAAQAGESTPANNAVVRFNEGVEALQIGDNATAILKMNEALEQNPELMEAVSALAFLHLQEKSYAAAAAAAEKVLVKEPQNEKILRIAFDAYKALGDKAKTATYQAALAAVDPVSAATELYNQGVVAYNAGDMGKARGYFEQSAAGNPDYATVHYMLGMCYASEGSNAKAKQSMETFISKAAADDPDLATAKEMLTFLK